MNERSVTRAKASRRPAKPTLPSHRTSPLSSLLFLAKIGVMNTKKRPQIHPSEILKEEFVEGMNQQQLAEGINVSVKYINIIQGKHAITIQEYSFIIIDYLYSSHNEFWLPIRQGEKYENDSNLS